jgi:hypothetical protein
MVHVVDIFNCVSVSSIPTVAARGAKTASRVSSRNESLSTGGLEYRRFDGCIHRYHPIVLQKNCVDSVVGPLVGRSLKSILYVHPDEFLDNITIGWWQVVFAGYR